MTHQRFRRSAKQVERKTGEIAQAAPDIAVALITPGTGDGPGAQDLQVPATDTPDHIDVFHQRYVPEASQLAVMTKAHDQPLIAIGKREDEAAQRHHSFEQAGFHAETVEGKGEARSPVIVLLVSAFDKGRHLLLPARAGKGIGMQEKKPGPARLRGAGGKLGATPFVTVNDATAHGIGDGECFILRPAITNDDLAHQAVGRSRHQRA